MSTTTTEYWSVIDRSGEDIPLQTLAMNIQSWGDTRQAVMGLRGSDVTIPWVPGDRRTTKVPASRVITLGMWVRGCDEDGDIPEIGQRSEFTANWQRIRELLFYRGEPFTLVKRFYDQSNTLRAVKGTAEFSSGLEPGMIGTSAAKFTVDLNFADPFFYGDSVDVDFDSTVSAGTVNTTVLGDWYARRISVDAAAGSSGCTTPSVSVETLTPNIMMSIPKIIFDDETIVFENTSQLARVNSVLTSALVAHSGSRDWLRLNPGDCTINFSAAEGSWAGTLTYLPAWY